MSKQVELDESKLSKDQLYDLEDFRAEDSGCSCHLNPPCSYCTHPGNPTNLIEELSNKPTKGGEVK